MPSRPVPLAEAAPETVPVKMEVDPPLEPTSQVAPSVEQGSEAASPKASAEELAASGSQPSVAAARKQVRLATDVVPATIDLGNIDLEETDDELSPAAAPVSGESMATDPMEGVEAASGSQPSAIPVCGKKRSGEASPGSQPSVHDAALTPDEAEAVMKFVNDTKKQKLENLKKSVSAPIFAMITQVLSLQKKYVADMTELTKTTFKRKTMVMDHSGRSQLKGFDIDRQMLRRQFAADARASDAFDEYRTKRNEMLLAHGQALLAVGAEKVVNLLPESMTTKRAVEIAQQSGAQSSGSQPSDVHSSQVQHGSQPSGAQRAGSVLRHPNYKDLLKAAGIIELPDNFRGRKPPVHCTESLRGGDEMDPDFDWGTWWMRLGGFKALFAQRIPSQNPENWTDLPSSIHLRLLRT